MVRIDREVTIFDQDFACLEVHRFGVEGRMDDVEGACRIRQRAIGGRLRVDDLGILSHGSSHPRRILGFATARGDLPRGGACLSPRFLPRPSRAPAGSCGCFTAEPRMKPASSSASNSSALFDSSNTASSPLSTISGVASFPRYTAIQATVCLSG